MTLEPLDALSRLAARRFASFADAANAVLDLLAGAVPGGCVLLGQVDWDAGECRVLDARGGAVERGSSLPLSGAADGAGLIGADTLAEVADTGEPIDAARAVEAAKGAFGRLDLLVCNAGIGSGGTVVEQTPESWDAVLRTNLTGAFLACRAALPLMGGLGRRGDCGGIAMTLDGVSHDPIATLGRVFKSV